MTTTENGHAPLTEQQVREAIAGVQEPELGRGLVELNMVPAVAIRERDVHLTVELASPIAPYKGKLEDELRAALAALPQVGAVTVEWATRVRSSSGGRSDAQPIKGVKNTIAVASGKGGVGKSTVAVNLAVSLARAGAAVGLLDADVYGPSIPLMMGRHDKPMMQEGKIVPLEAYGVRLMSIGFVLDPDRPVIWRGPMVSQLINQFLSDVAWGELDYLVIDLPPGTGDAQLTLAQKIPISGAVIVATPQDVALADAIKGLKMFQEVKTPILGIVEQNMIGVAAGLATVGFVPWISTFAAFIAKRALDQIRVVVAQPHLNVKLCGSYSGILTGKTGKTHQSVEDLAVFRAMPGMTTIAPADAVELRAAMAAMMETPGPVYLRLTRDPSPTIFPEDYRFAIGRGVRLRDGGDVALIGTGVQTVRVLEAAELLSAQGIEASVLHLPTLKPLDVAAIVAVAERTGAIVTAEDHSIVGGLGGAVAETLAEHRPTLIRRVGLRDTYGESGPNDAILEKYGLTPRHVAEAALNLLVRAKASGA